MEILSSLDPCVLSPEEQEYALRLLRDDLKERCRAINQQDRQAWSGIKSREDWTEFCAPRIEALRKSLGTFPETDGEMYVKVTKTIRGEGYCIQNLVYESRAGVFVTANLYLPSEAAEQMPAIMIVHSHHNPKTQGELQDMGMTWARSGCAVLVIDQLSYGERRQHAPGPRQDYRFRYINGIQLYLLGDSLMGWMVRDVMRGIDLLLNHYSIDRNKVILIGSVAGGGDVAAVAAAIDRRITCAIPFNFGGPQPETRYPLPEDAEETFNYMGYGSWESTRNLRLSGYHGFLPWVIVASVAPRYLIYAHEFSWDRERDPVWKRLQKVYEFHNVPDRLAFAHGAGLLSGKPPEATHCNNVGPVHRKMIHPVLERWFGITVPQEYQNRLSDDELRCLISDTPKTQPLHKLFSGIGVSRSEEARNSLAKLKLVEKRDFLRHRWAKLLGNIEPESTPKAESIAHKPFGNIRVERIVLRTESNIAVPMLGLVPPHGNGKCPAVIGVAQSGKSGFLKERAQEISEILRRGIAVFLPDLRDTGETCRSPYRGRQSEATSISAAEMMLGKTLLGSRLMDLRQVIRYVGMRSDVEPGKIALWGDSFAPVNSTEFSDPLIDGEEQLHQSEPLGGLLALFGALYEDSVCAVAARGMIAGYQFALRDRFCYVPYDAVIPGALMAGDLCDVAAAIAPRPLRLEGLVDGRNCPVTVKERESFLKPVLQAYGDKSDRLSAEAKHDDHIAFWLSEILANSR